MRVFKFKRGLLCFIVLALLIKPIWSASSFVPLETNQTFRDEIIDFIHMVAKHRSDSASLFKINEIDSKWSNHYQRSDWTIKITTFYRGSIVGTGLARGSSLANVLEQATKLSLLHEPNDRLFREDVSDYRFLITFYFYPSSSYSM